MINMGVVRFVLSDELENRLRKVALKKGDLSKIGEAAIKEYLNKLEVSK